MNATRSHTAETMTNAALNKRDAFALLDVQEDYGASKENMLDELTFGFGYTPEQAERVYNEWAKKKQRAAGRAGIRAREQQGEQACRSQPKSY